MDKREELDVNKKEKIRNEERELERKMKKLKREKILKPIFAVSIFLVIILLLVMVIWAVLNPSVEMKRLMNRDKDITENVRKGIQIEELQAEIESLNEQIDEYKEKILELEGRLAITDTNESTEGAETEE